MAKKGPPSEKELAMLRANKAPTWQKGQSGNPKGYPKGRPNRSTILRELLGLTLKKPDGKNADNPFDTAEKKITIEKAIEIVLVQKALKGNLDAIREIKDTIHGKMTEKTELTGAEGGPIETKTLVMTAEQAYKDMLKVEVKK